MPYLRWYARPVSRKRPKSTCCLSKPRCKRCPIRMLREGTLPEGYSVKKRKLVKVRVKGKGKGSGSKTKSAKVA